MTRTGAKATKLNAPQTSAAGKLNRIRALGKGERELTAKLVRLPRLARKSLVIALDLILCVLSVWIAYSLRLGQWELLTQRVIVFIGLTLLTWICICAANGTYKSMTRFADAHTLRSLLTNCVLMSLCLAAVVVWVPLGVPRTLSVIHPIIFFLGLLSVRSIISRLILNALRDEPTAALRRRVLVYGAGYSGQQVANSLAREPGFELVGFLDENRTLRKSLLLGKTIWHSSDVQALLGSSVIDEVVLAVPSMKRRDRRSMVEKIAKYSTQVRVRSLPTFAELASGRVSVTDLRDVQIEELLGRDEVAPNSALMRKHTSGRCVLVTGAGGSIGSELCRQIIQQRPARLILAEQSEYALFTIEMELQSLCKAGRVPVELCVELVNVADQGQCQRLLRRHNPHTVFHAAAYKHVPLVEANPAAGIRNNVLGTLNLALASEQSGVGKFILVSTDKAVRPTNVMGATKRVCELIIQGRALAQDSTSYCSVRFGNVLGSSGSVIPHFRQQIASGGPVTITHRDATRYFMTIPEAAQLVIQAASLAGDGEVLLLEMGEPVRIRDLAQLMIELSGLTVADETNPDGDIKIEEIGLRPGEKIIEELLIDNGAETTAHPRIVKARERMIPWDNLFQELLKLFHFVDAGDGCGAVSALRSLVPEFCHNQDAGTNCKNEVHKSASPKTIVQTTQGAQA